MDKKIKNKLKKKGLWKKINWNIRIKIKVR